MIKRTANAETSAQGTRLLNADELDLVTGGRSDEGTVVIVGCTTPPPFGGYPRGTIVWNPWLNPYGPGTGGR